MVVGGSAAKLAVIPAPPGYIWMNPPPGIVSVSLAPAYLEVKWFDLLFRMSDRVNYWFFQVEV